MGGNAVMQSLLCLILALLVGSTEARFARGTPGASRTQVSIASYGAACDGVTDDTAAFSAFKTANQGTTPIQLNLPGFCAINAASLQSPFRGISDLIVQGTGTATSGIKNMGVGPQSLLLGGSAQAQDNLHSVRTTDANPGDSCVTMKTGPAKTISNATNSLPVPATFTASISGTTLTVRSVSSGTIAAGATLNSQGSGVTPFTTILRYGTAGTTGTGGTGTYAISISQTGGAGIYTTSPASFTADFGVSTPNVLTVSAVADGTITPGMFVYSNGGGIRAPMTIAPYGRGGTTGVGGTGTYMLNVPPASGSVSSRAFIGNGQIRLTVNSTTGLTTGDTLFVRGVVATGNIQNAINGLQWIKVVDGTHIDLFQKDFNGLYTSGGTAGGDRTSLFPNGTKALMTGWINQAYWAVPYGYPSNPNWFEYKTVASTNPGTQQVCFTTPLSLAYKASWPQYNTGSRFEVDPGGPATLYALDSTWDMTVVLKDLTLDSATQSVANARNVTLNDVAMTGGNCFIPSQNETLTWTDVTGTDCDIEVDKIIKTWNLTNVTVKKIAFQSSAIEQTNMNNVTITGDIIGIGKKLVAQNLNVTGTYGGSFTGQFQIGKTFYGTPQEFSCTNCSVAGDVSGIGNGNRVDSPTVPWSMSGGVITIPNAYSLSGDYEIATAQTLPGNYMFWKGSGGGGTSYQYGRALKIVSVSQDIDNTYLTTSESGGYPTGAWTTLGLSLAYHPAPTFSAINMTGSDVAKSYSGCTTPMHSCQNFVHTNNTTGGALSPFRPFLLGELDTFTFTNNVSYTGGGTLNWQISQFNNWPILKTDLTQVSYGNPTTDLANGQSLINVKLPTSCGSCTRTLTKSGASNTQTGDTVTRPPAGALFGGSSLSFPVFSTGVNGAKMTVTMKTDQHLR